ncbi:MAG TPA: efflux RND transporter periplasmic adaptor subunit, partial [Candidatus Brocadiia bacterium]|nr:efflux RND transporter periplasmic adaptor subunit [Candidatus Brocadiia bacterium]
KQALAKLAGAQIALAQEEERRAESAVAIAEKELRDSVAVAPIDGVVSKRMAEPGENGERGKAVIRIDDVRQLEASAQAPGQFYPLVKPGQTKARLTVGGKALGEFTIWYKSPTVDTALRTFEVKCDVPGDRSLAVPGALVEMAIVLEQREGLGVPAESVQLRGGKPVVFVLNGNEARMVAAETGLETEGWVEARGPGLSEGTPVVRQGQFLLNDGSPVAVRKAGG